MYGIEYFSNISKYIENGDKISYTGVLVASKLNQKNGQDYPLIDLVDIDFNGAFIPSLNCTMNTAYDLIHVLDVLNKSNDIIEVNSQIEQIWKQLNEITSTYVTYSTFSELLDKELQENWQRKLEAGTYISIDTESNPQSYVISVTGLPTYDYLENTYTSKGAFFAFKQEIYDNYWDSETTTSKITDAIAKVIDGAPDAFDTLKEISDWILSQNRYEEIPWYEALNNWKDDYYFIEILDENQEGTGKYEIVSSSNSILIESGVNADFIVDNFDTYYFCYLNEETGEYVFIESLDNIIDGKTFYYCKTKYYVEKNYLTDIQELLERVNRLDETVGTKIYNSIYNSYVYTGHCKDIYDLQVSDSLQNTTISKLSDRVFNAEEVASNAYSKAEEAIICANEAKDIANESKTIAEDAKEISLASYDLAYEAIEKVGMPTVEAHYSYVDSEELFNELKATGYELQAFYNGVLLPGDAENYIDKEEYQYAYYVSKVEGTGLTKRVEDVEELSYDAYRKSEAALEASYDALYHLMVNNDNSSYVTLSLHPENYYGERNRTIYVSTQEASVNSKDGTIVNDGLVNIATAFDIYTYASSWMMLYVDQDVNFEDISK